MTGEPRIPCTTAPQQDKKLLRSTLKARRGAIDPALKQAFDARIGAHVLAWLQACPQAAVGVYWPLAGEPDLLPAYGKMAAQGVRLALPVVVERHAALGFAEWTPGEEMVEDRMGIAVPADLRLIDRPPALLVPCLGFNSLGYRVGYGGGFYDRTLAPQPRPVTVGIAYACQLAEFSGDAHDVPLDRVITEEWRRG